MRDRMSSQPPPQCPLTIGKAHSEPCSVTALAAGVIDDFVTVIVGRDDGTVLMYRRSDASSDDAHYDLTPGWEVRLEDKLEERRTGSHRPRPYKSTLAAAVSKRPITQLCVDDDQLVVVVLSDTAVSLYTLVDGKKLALAAHVVEEKKIALKGIVCMCTSKYRGVHRLVVAVKKRAQLFQYTRSSISPLEDMEYSQAGSNRLALDARSNDPILAVCLVGTLLCIASKEEYRVLDLRTSNVTAVIDRKLHRGQPVMLARPELGHMMLQCGKKTTTVDQTGEKRFNEVKWREVPQGLHYQDPFYLVSIGEGIAVHTMLDAQSSAQTGAVDVPLTRKLKPFAASCSVKGLVCVATHADIYELSPVPHLEQVADLVTSGTKEDVDLALSLMQATFEGDDLAEKEIHCFLFKRAGFACLDAANFSDAMTYFAKVYQDDDAYMDVREILTLFGLHGALQKYMTGISSSRRNVREVLAMYPAGARKSMLADARMALYRYLETVRVPYFDLDQPVKPEHQAIDTALLLLYLDLFPDASEEADSEVWSILRDGNCLEYEFCLAELESRRKYRCLALLKVHNGLVAEALRMLYTMGNGGEYQEEGQDGVAETVLALQHCSGGESGLVLEYLPWVLERDPRAVKALLVPRDPPLDPAKVFDLLRTQPDDIIMEYLEYLIAEGNTEKRYHTQLALIYINSIQKLMRLCPHVAHVVPPGREAGLLGELRRKLQGLLHKAAYDDVAKTYYDPVKVLAQLYGTQLHHELVIVYSYVEEHEAALKILMYKIRDEEAASRYCKQQYQRALRRHLVASMVGRFDSQPLVRRPSSPVTRRKTDSTLLEQQSPSSSRNSPVHLSPEVSRAHENDDDSEDEEKKLDLEQAMARPDEFFALHNDKLPVSDKAGNVYVGIGKHNTYLLELVKQCLFPGEGEVGKIKANTKLALELLYKHSAELDPLRVLKLLPMDGEGALSIHELRPYLREVFRRTSSEAKDAQINKGLASSNKLKCELDRAVLLNRYVIIDSERPCDTCHKRIGESYTGIYPNLKVVHFPCMKNRNTLDPKTGQPFWVDTNNVRPRSKFCGAK